MKVEFGIKPDLFDGLGYLSANGEQVCFRLIPSGEYVTVFSVAAGKEFVIPLIMLVVGSYPSVADVSRYFPVILEIMAQCYIGSNVREVFGGKSGIDRSAPFR